MAVKLGTADVDNMANVKLGELHLLNMESSRFFSWL
jgi:hypothetical protein